MKLIFISGGGIMHHTGRLNITIFHKLFLVFLLAIITFFGFSMYMNIQGAKNLEKELTKSTLSNVSFFLKDFEENVYRLKEKQKQFLNSYELQKVSLAAHVMSPYERTKSIQNLQERIMDFEMGSNYIENVILYIPILERKISTKPVIDSLSIDEYKKVINKFNKGSDDFIFDGKLYLNTAFLAGEYAGTGYPPYAVTIEISKQRLIETMAGIFKEEEAGAVLFGNNMDWYIAANEEIVHILKESFENDSTVWNDNESKTKRVKINNKEYLLMPVYSRYLNMLLVTYIPSSVISGPYQKSLKWAWYLSVLSVLILIFYYFFTYKMFASPMDKLIRGFKEVETGNLNFTINHKSGDEFGYIYKQYNTMIKELNKSIQQVYEYKIRAQYAELKQLQYQINPHFLYNSIYLIYRMAKDEEYDNIVRLSLHLADYYRFITRNNMDDIPLKKEAGHARNYVEIQSIRFGDRIDVNFGDIPEGLEDFMVPPLIIQPIIENAYGHGLKDREMGGRIDIRMYMDGKFLVISVEDNGTGMNSQELINLQQKLESADIHNETTGIINVHRRLRIKFGEKSGLKVSRGKMGGTLIELIIQTDGGERNVQSAAC